MDVRFYLSLFWRRVHWFLLFVVIGAAVGITLAQVWPTTYVARARLLVESEQIPGDLAASTVQTEATEQLQIIQQRIMTRNTLIDMANRLNVYPRQPGKPALSPDEIVADMRRRIEIATTGGASPRRRGPVQATLVAVSFRASSGQLAATVANELVTQILREDIEMRTGVARQTLDFFEQEVARLDQELAKRGQVILEFKEKNQDSLPDSLDFRRSRQAALTAQLQQLDAAQTQVSDRRERAIQVHRNVNETPSAIASGQSTDETATPRTAFEKQIIELDAELARLEAQKADLRTQLQEIQATINATPSNAITLDTLERDYANVRAQYDQAVANKARAETGDMIEALSKGERITVIEQAVAPRAPEQPNRPILAAGGLGGGIFLGLAAVVLLEFLNKGIRRPAELTAKLGITPIATLPYLRTRRELWVRRFKIICILGFFMGFVPLVLLALHFYYMPLDQIFEMLMDRVRGAALVTNSDWA